MTTSTPNIDDLIAAIRSVNSVECRTHFEKVLEHSDKVLQEVRRLSRKALNAIRTNLKAMWSEPPPEVATTSLDLRRPIVTGITLVIIGFGGFTLWSALIPLSSAVVAPGVISVESKRKVVQHLEGGIVAEIATREGQEVKAGDLLLRLDQTQSAARYSQFQAKLIAAATEKARLEAELTGRDELDVSATLQNRVNDPAVARAMALQSDLLASRRREREQRLAILNAQIEQIRHEVQGLQAQIAGRERKRALTEERFSGIQQLASKGYASRVQVAALEGELATIDGEIGDLKARISSSQQKMGQLNEQILNVDATLRAEIAERLQATQRDYTEAHEALSAAEDVKRRTDILAPISGTVVGLKQHTVGAVVPPGEPLLEIVPAGDALVVEASIGTEDIDVVHPGLAVKVRLSAYSFRSTSPISGTLVHVSADRVVDSKTGLATYPARAVLDNAELGRLKNVQLYPGMTAEVLIVKGERTLLDYLLDPLLRATERSFIEN